MKPILPVHLARNTALALCLLAIPCVAWSAETNDELGTTSPNAVPLVVIGPPPSDSTASATKAASVASDAVPMDEETSISIMAPQLSQSQTMRLDAYFGWVDLDSTTGNFRLKLGNSGEPLDDVFFDDDHFPGSDQITLTSEQLAEVTFRLKQSGFQAADFKKGYLIFLGRMTVGTTNYQAVYVFRIDI